MSSGFVYVMMNPAMRGLVKIGRTNRTPAARSTELRGTGVPDEFVVIYDELVTDCELVEKRIHKRFSEYRYQRNREFFRIPIREAIRGLVEEASEFIVGRIGSSGGVEMLPDLKRRYRDYLKPDLHSIKIVQRDDVVYLETVRYAHARLRDEIVERTDLGFIIEDVRREIPMFLPSRTSADNARLFVHELDEFSLIHCTDIFTEAACRKIADRHEKRRSDGPAPQDD